MNSPTNGISIEDRLREVYEKTDSREYAEALDVLEIARSSDPGNIYVAALRRQLDALLSLSQADDLSEDQRHELMEPMPGIIACALRDTQRENRSGITDLSRTQQGGCAPAVPSPAGATDFASDHSTDGTDVQKELEALKLLYFQRASKLVMKGEYEQALAEVRRVFVVDPENTIAKEYASRVEHLIQHARRLASEPRPSSMPTFDGPREDPQTIQVDPAPNPEELPHVHTERSTAWDDDFIAPKTSALIPEHRRTPPSSRLTVAYADSLAVSLSPVRNAERDDDYERPVRKKSKLFLLLATAILTPLLAGVAVAIFSPKNAGTALRSDVRAEQTQNLNPGPSVEGTIGVQGNRVPEETAPKGEEHQHVTATLTAKTSPPPAELKGDSDPAPTKTDLAPQPVAVELPKSDPLKASTPATESAPPKPEPPVVEPPLTSTPAFIPVERDPQIVKLEKPEFPVFVWNMGIEGRVVVRVLIDPNGKPLDSQILKSTNTVFEQPVIDAVMKSQFTPAQMGQGPVAAWLTIPFKFSKPK
jgi:TonB family protein